METFAPSREFVTHPGYSDDRTRALASLDLEAIDAPIRSIIAAFSNLTLCFTLQCCWGHFLHASQGDPHNTERLPAKGVKQVQYRIAYLALCIEDSLRGRHLRSLLEDVQAIDREYIQFGSPEWFWDQQVNSYALQVEPGRLKDRDVVTIATDEALRVQQVRDLFFDRVAEVLQMISNDRGAAYFHA